MSNRRTGNEERAWAPCSMRRSPLGLVADRRGGALVEYILMLGLVMVVGLAAWPKLGAASNKTVKYQAECGLLNADCGGPPSSAAQGKAPAVSPGLQAKIDALAAAAKLPDGATPPDGGFWNGVGNFLSDAWGVTKSVGTGFFVDGLWGTVTGVWQVVTHPIDTVQSLWTAVTNPVQTFNAVKDALVNAWNEDPARLIGAGIFEVVTAPIAALKATKLVKATKVIEAVDDAADAAKLADKAADAAKVADKVDDASDAAKAAAAANKALPHASPETIHFSQKSVSDKLTDGTKLDDVIEDMRKNGWDYTKDPPDVVRTADGKLVTADNRRILAAREAGIDEIPMKVHGGADKIPADQAGRFTLKKNFTDPDTGRTYPKGSVPETWEEAIKFRGRNQGGDFPAGGSLDKPVVKPSAPGADD